MGKPRLLLQHFFPSYLDGAEVTTSTLKGEDATPADYQRSKTTKASDSKSHKQFKGEGTNNANYDARKNEGPVSRKDTSQSQYSSRTTFKQNVLNDDSEEDIGVSVHRRGTEGLGRSRSNDLENDRYFDPMDSEGELTESSRSDHDGDDEGSGDQARPTSYYEPSNVHGAQNTAVNGKHAHGPSSSPRTPEDVFNGYYEYNLVRENDRRRWKTGWQYCDDNAKTNYTSAYMSAPFNTPEDHQRLQKVYCEMMESPWTTTIPADHFSTFKLIAKILLAPDILVHPDDTVPAPQLKAVEGVDALTFFLHLAVHKHKSGDGWYNNSIGTQLSYHAFLRLAGSPNLSILKPEDDETWFNWLQRAQASVVEEPEEGWDDAVEVDRAAFYRRMAVFMDLVPGMKTCRILPAWRVEGQGCLLSYIYRRLLENVRLLPFRNCYLSTSPTEMAFFRQDLPSRKSLGPSDEEDC